MQKTVAIPVQSIGPIHITGPHMNDAVTVPLATFETPMWPSTNRGASVTRRGKGVSCTLLDERMTRSVVLSANSASELKQVLDDLKAHTAELQAVISATSRFCRLIDWHSQVVGNLLFLRLEATTGDASGHNMLTKAADAVIPWLLNRYAALHYVSISGNICTDKKVSAINGLLGRGKSVVAEMVIPAAVCQERLKTTAQAIHQLNIKKNLVGSSVAGGLRTANAHYANLLYALYLATGQDVANIVEGSQGFTYTEVRGDDLYFSVNLPNIIVGTVGNGKHLDFVQQHLSQLGCTQTEVNAGDNARRLAMIVAATVWCGELSLMAAQTNPGELMRAHEKFERASTQATKHDSHQPEVMTADT